MNAMGFRRKRNVKLNCCNFISNPSLCFLNQTAGFTTHEIKLRTWYHYKRNSCQHYRGFIGSNYVIKLLNNRLKGITFPTTVILLWLYLLYVYLCVHIKKQVLCIVTCREGQRRDFYYKLHTQPTKPQLCMVRGELDAITCRFAWYDAKYKR